MAEDLIRYDILAQDALRGVIRKVLSEVARTGLPGDHHFFIKFSTTAPGVRISGRLLIEYPEEMRIILQHHYWDLTVTEHAFEVGLSFNGVPERLLVPFTAVRSFEDPSVKFELHFQVASRGDEAILAEAEAAIDGETPLAIPDESAGELTGDEDDNRQAGAAEVVRLDAFRKK